MMEDTMIFCELQTLLVPVVIVIVLVSGGGDSPEPDVAGN